MNIDKREEFHRVWKRRTVLPVICLAAFLCCGCGELQWGSVSGGDAYVQPKINYMESTPVVDYTVPRTSPNVLVNLAGYPANGDRQAALKGRKMPERFNLVDADTGEVVFTGAIEDVEYNAETELYSAYADFDGWSGAGNYYLECEHVGRSYSFVIEEDFYERLFDEIYREKLKGCEERTIALADVAQLLLAYEWYPEIFPDEDQDQTPDVLEKIASWIDATAENPVESGAEALYAATLAKFSYLYQKFDRQYATDCVKRASVVFSQTQSTMQKDAECFYALTELYRATGLYTYRRQIKEYKTYFENHGNFVEDKGYLYGSMTYISTRQKVDLELCALFIDTLMAQGEEIGNIYQEMVRPVNARNNGVEDLLKHAECLACANYVMNNYQYNQIMEEFLHYLRGRNQQSVDFYAERVVGEADEGYLILLAQLVAVQQMELPSETAASK